ncbi:MAG TPA: hypothetical protein VIA63_00610 [Candidatus Limnocylindria bacterium]
MGRIAKRLELVDEAVELGMVRRVVVDEDEEPARPQDPRDLREGAAALTKWCAASRDVTTSATREPMGSAVASAWTRSAL